MGHKEPLEPIAFDLETEGLLMNNEITVAGLRFPLGALVLLNTNGRTVSEELGKRIQERSGLDTVQVQVCDSERDLLKRLRKEAGKRIRGGREANSGTGMLVAYNGETWRGGFDLSFLRTRCGFNDVCWPFDDIPYSDLMPIVQKRINTTVDGGTAPQRLVTCAGLTTHSSTATTVTRTKTQMKPFLRPTTVSGESLVLHNVADLNRTQQLADWMQRYVPASDFKLKNLGPPRGGRW